MARTVKNFTQANNTITTNPNTATQTRSQANITAAQSQIQDARIHLMNSQTATQASNAPVGQISVSEIEALLAGKTLKEQVNDFRRNTYKLYRDPDLSIDDVERNGKIAEHLDSILANDTSSFARRSRRNIKRTQSFLEKKILRKELNTLNKEITDLLNSDQAITAEDLEKIVQHKEKLQKLLDKHANNFLLEKLAKNIDKKLDKLFDKFLTPLRPKMQNLTDKLSKIIKAGTSISFDEHVKLQDEYDELLLKFGSLEHSEIKNFKDSSDRKFSQISIEEPIYIWDPIPLPNPFALQDEALAKVAETLFALNQPHVSCRHMPNPVLESIPPEDIKLMKETYDAITQLSNPLNSFAKCYDGDLVVSPPKKDIDLINFAGDAVLKLFAKYQGDDRFNAFFFDAKNKFSELQRQIKDTNSQIDFGTKDGSYQIENNVIRDSLMSNEFIEIFRGTLDVDQSSFHEALANTDGELIIRYVQGLRGGDLVRGIASRRQGPKIEENLKLLEELGILDINNNGTINKEDTNAIINLLRKVTNPIAQPLPLPYEPIMGPMPINPINGHPILIRPILTEPGQALKTSGISLVTATEVDNRGGINESTEYAFSSFKIDFYQSQKTGLENLMDEYISMDDDSGFARAQITKLRSQMNTVNSSIRFWNRRNNSWQEKSFSEDRLQVGDNAFSAFKIEFNRSQLTGLENLMDEYISMGDESDFANRKIAKLNAQINTLESVDSFWVEQNKFWREENTALYKQEDITKVQDIYKQIEEQETLVDSALNNQDLNGTINSKAKLAKLQEDLSQIRQGFKKENTQTFSFDTPQEKANANSKKEFYQSQKTGLENLMDQYLINDDNDFAKAEITKLRSQMNKVNIATTFWQEQEKFFEDFSKYQFKTEDQAKVTDLMSIIKEISNLIDQSLFKDDESGSAHSDIANLREKLYLAQSELVRLGYN